MEGGTTKLSETNVTSTIQEDDLKSTKLYGLVRFAFQKKSTAINGALIDLNLANVMDGEKVIGVKVIGVKKNSIADRLGKKANDYIISIDGLLIRAIKDFDGRMEVHSTTFPTRITVARKREIEYDIDKDELPAGIVRKPNAQLFLYRFNDSLPGVIGLMLLDDLKVQYVDENRDGYMVGIRDDSSMDAEDPPKPRRFYDTIIGADDQPMATKSQFLDYLASLKRDPIDVWVMRELMINSAPSAMVSISQLSSLNVTIKTSGSVSNVLNVSQGLDPPPTISTLMKSNQPSTSNEMPK